MGQSVIIIVDYDPAWPGVFEQLKHDLLLVLAPVAVAIEHTGSTAVPLLAAKPIIDLDVVVKRADMSQAVALLESLGYVHQGNLGIKDREAFRAPAGSTAHHLYLCPEDSNEFKRHIAFRNYLRSNPMAREVYGTLKRDLALVYGADRHGYTEAKTAFITQCLAECARQIQGSVGNA